MDICGSFVILVVWVGPLVLRYYMYTGSAAERLKT